MEHVYTLLMLIGPCSVLGGLVPAPTNLTISSHHFIHLLTWKAGPNSPQGLHYTVVFRSLNVADWKPVDSCQAVRSPLFCNLTDVFSDLEGLYFVRVTAVLGNEMSIPISNHRAFIPVSDTVRETPSLRLSSCNDSLCVYLHSPSERLHKIYETFQYTLNVTLGKDNEFTVKTKGLDPVTIKVVRGLEYCVSVNITDPPTPADKPPVCASTPAAVNNMDPVTAVFFPLALMFLVIPCLLVLRSLFCLKTHLPFVLSSFNAPYKVQLISFYSVESETSISLEPQTDDVQVSTEVDQENEDEEVAYERRGGVEESVCCEEDTRFLLSSSTVVQYERNPSQVIEKYTHVPETHTEEHTLAPDSMTGQWEVTTPQTTSQILTAAHMPTPNQELIKTELALIRHKRGDELGQEEGEGSDEVNFSSLTLGGRKTEQLQEKMGNGQEVKPEVQLLVPQTPKLAPDIQPTYSESTNKHISYSEDTDEDEAFSGYMMRN